MHHVSSRLSFRTRTRLNFYRPVISAELASRTIQTSPILQHSSPKADKPDALSKDDSPPKTPYQRSHFKNHPLQNFLSKRHDEKVLKQLERELAFLSERRSNTKPGVKLEDVVALNHRASELRVKIELLERRMGRRNGLLAGVVRDESKISGTLDAGEVPVSGAVRGALESLRWSGKERDVENGGDGSKTTSTFPELYQALKDRIKAKYPHRSIKDRETLLAETLKKVWDWEDMKDTFVREKDVEFLIGGKKGIEMLELLEGKLQAFDDGHGELGPGTSGEDGEKFELKDEEDDGVKYEENWEKLKELVYDAYGKINGLVEKDDMGKLLTDEEIKMWQKRGESSFIKDMLGLSEFNWN